MRLTLMAIAALGVALAVAAGNAAPEQSGAPAVAAPPPVAAPFTPWTGGLALLDRDTALGRGQECPGGSGSYCTDRFPVCCASGGRYSCQASC